MNNFPAASGSPVHRCDLSEHVLYDLDAYAGEALFDCEDEGADEEPWIEGYILTRAEGRADDPEWPVGRTVVCEHLTSRIDDRLRRAAKALTHDGYDKFDIEVVYSDGDRVRLRLDLDRHFSRITDALPTLSR